MILYLHGFRSSPKSSKAQIMHQALKANGIEKGWFCPQLPPEPSQAIALCNELIEKNLKDNQSLSIIGSSLGGFYATYIAEQWPQAKAVTLNPVVFAARDLAHYVGPLTNFHTNEPFHFTKRNVDDLAQLEIKQITQPERYLLIAATGDELLDWREMATHYTGAKQIIIEGGDHGLSDFEQYLPDIFLFLGLTAPSSSK